MSDLLKVSGRFIEENREKYLKTDNDGIFCHDEFQWGNHLGNYTADHSDVIGLGNLKLNHLYDRIFDNLNYHFDK